jgi:hypothetical protein
MMKKRWITWVIIGLVWAELLVSPSKAHKPGAQAH